MRYMLINNSIQQQPENALGKYNLSGDGLILALLRAVLIFMGGLLVLIVVGMLALDGTFDIMGLVVWMVSTPFAIVNALFIWLLYRFNIDRKPLMSGKYCLLECMLVFAVLIFCAWWQNYLADIMWNEPVEVRFWYSELATVLITVLAVPSFYLVKKWIGICIKKA